MVEAAGRETESSLVLKYVIFAKDRGAAMSGKKIKITKEKSITMRGAKAVERKGACERKRTST